MESFFQWDRFITPTVIRILYWIAMVVVIIAGIVMFIMGLVKMTFSMVVLGIAYVILGPIAVRIYAELLLLWFRVYETLIEIRDRTPGAGSPPAA